MAESEEGKAEEKEARERKARLPPEGRAKFLGKKFPVHHEGVSGKDHEVPRRDVGADQDQGEGVGQRDGDAPPGRSAE